MGLSIILFVLLAQFLLKSLDKFLGKGLDIILITEFIFLNLAWIIALAVPMAILISTLMAFGRMSYDNEITAIRSSGVSFIQVLLPALFFGTFITVIMIFFNDKILPEMNHKARLLSSDIGRKRPDLDFDVGYFINSLPNNTILLGGREDQKFTDIIIFNNSNSLAQRTITANSGTIKTLEDGIMLNLSDGVIHEMPINNDEYREIYYDKYQIVIPIDNMAINRRDSKIRGDREMTSKMISDKIELINNKVINTYSRINQRLSKENIIISDEEKTLDNINKYINTYRSKIADSLKLVKPSKVAFFNKRMNNLARGVKSDFMLIKSHQKSINKYQVEYYKKVTIPFACIVFILIGAPLGIIARKGGFPISMAISIGFFIIYWSFLIGGEEFADRGLVDPGLAMWSPNIFIGILGVFLCYRLSKEQFFFKFDFIKLFSKNNDSELN